MRLIGLPLLLLTSFLALAAIVGTVLLWSRFGRWRLLVRPAGVLLSEALVVLAAGLAFNRADNFYPSWQALTGDTGTTSQTAVRPAGRLDALLSSSTNLALPWQARDLASWRLAATPTVVFPADYRDQKSTTYPVVVVLTDGPSGTTAALQAARRTEGVLTVIATPTSKTTAPELGRLAGDLNDDVRATKYGWGLVATTRVAALAAALIDGAPQRYAGEALLGSAQPAGVVLTAPVPTAFVEQGTAPKTPAKTPPKTPAKPPAKTPAKPPAKTPAKPPAKTPAKPPAKTPPKTPEKTPVKTPVKTPEKVPTAAGANSVPPAPPKTVTPVTPVATTLFASPATVWTVALRWAADQTSRPLRPAVELPVGKP